MKTYLLFILIAILASCNFISSDNPNHQPPKSSFKIKDQLYIVTLHHESFTNGDGLINRIITIEYPDKKLNHFTAHVAHYNDNLSLKILVNKNQSFLIAEDKTGYTAWNIENKKLAAMSGSMENNRMVEQPIGTAEDYMTHEPLSNIEWKRALKLTSVKDTDFTQLEWQL